MIRVHRIVMRACFYDSMKRFATLLGLCAFVAACAPARAADRMVFAVVMSRHGVRSFTKQSQYAMADWSPVPPGFLTAHGYRLMTYMGRYYASYFSSVGIPVNCSTSGTFVYADVDQRTLETARALIEGACGSPNAIALFHIPGKGDPLFRGAIRVAEKTADPAVAKGAESGEALFLEYAQCRPLSELGATDDRAFTQTLQSALQQHVLEYQQDDRGTQPLARGGNIFAHIVGLLDAKAGVADSDVDVPNISAANVAFIVGHDTQLGALAGILDAHWAPGGGIIADDTPTGGAIVFELYRTDANAYRVRLRFVTQTLQQFRSNHMLSDGIVSVPVRFKGCSGDDCSMSLDRFSAIAHGLASQGYVQKSWPSDTDAPVTLAPLADPPWTHCEF
jgi:4-phytase / acid phosphatase